MSLPAEKVAEVLALPEPDRAYLAKRLIASLDSRIDEDLEEQWFEVIDRRSQQIEEGEVVCRPVREAIESVRSKVHADRRSS